MNIVEVKNLRKTYKDLIAVNDLDIKIKKGDLHGILGPNGAGKSTLLSCITGLLEFDKGEVLFEGEKALKKWSKHIGYVPQELAIYLELSPYENVSFFASLHGYRGKELDKRVMEAIDFVGLMDVKDKKSAEFSGGMKRRLNLACALAHSPKLIIMDEPTVGIDPQSRNRILENVKELNTKGITIIYTTHYMEEVEAICNKITVIDYGKVIASGTKEEIKNKMRSSAVFLLDFDKKAGDKEQFVESVRKIYGVESVNLVSKEEDRKEIQDRWMFEINCSDESVLNAIIKDAFESKMVIKSINKKELSLEEIFLILTGKGLRD